MQDTSAAWTRYLEELEQQAILLRWSRGRAPGARPAGLRARLADWWLAREAFGAAETGRIGAANRG